MESDDQTALKMTLGNLILNNLRMISDQLLTGLILKLTIQGYVSRSRYLHWHKII